LCHNFRSADTFRHLLLHTSGITGFENEEVMKYYGAIGHARATIMPRYFMSDDENVRKEALEDVLEAMGSLVFLCAHFIIYTNVY